MKFYVVLIGIEHQNIHGLFCPLYLEIKDYTFLKELILDYSNTRK